ncbi:hypothetical protein KIH86_23885 [Paenibacillus sp. HN-1]|uniref:hypothetical protein n=1 Tax=Paenibacillus TaxID=44249 RepID=UPI001CA9B21A|nr:MULTISPECIES: hypothetical protein [Paenibacillus]MBY9081192.1 hypothetical protein [Paenibacillus sp. CGMCC 1.18879]MBY9087229.1 hypothetical protein [Paenibacillus sinensis]
MEITKLFDESRYVRVVGNQKEASVIQHILEFLAQKGYTVKQAVDILEKSKSIAFGCTPLSSDYPISSSKEEQIHQE